MDPAASETYAHLQATQRERAVRCLLTILDPQGDVRLVFPSRTREVQRVCDGVLNDEL